MVNQSLCRPSLDWSPPRKTLLKRQESGKIARWQEFSAPGMEKMTQGKGRACVYFWSSGWFGPLPARENPA